MAEQRLAEALRWLRLQAQLTQDQVCERVRACGGEISLIYLSMLERGQRNPSPQMLDHLLQALNSDRSHLQTLYHDQPWTAAPLPRGASAPRIRRHEALHTSQSAPPETWSSNVTTAASAAPDEQLAELAQLWPRLPKRRRDELLSLARRHARKANQP